MKAEDFLSAPSAEDFLTGADGSGEMTIPVKRRRGTEKARYVAPDNPDNPIAPVPGLVAESIRMPAPTFDEERKGRAAVDALIAKTTAPAPRAPRPQRDIKGVAQDLYSILGNTGVQLVKPFVDVPNMLTGGALDGASRFLSNAGQAANLAASPTTNYDRDTLGQMPEGASIDKVAHLISNPGLAANMGVPSVASMAMPLGYAKGMSALFPRAAAALGPEFQTATAVGANALMNAGDTFGQTESSTAGKLLAALGSGVSSALVGKATGGGLEGHLARGGKIPTVGAALKGVGNESLQEFGENVGNSLAQDTGQGNPLNFAKALDEGAIGAVLAPFVSGPVNLAGVATSPERANARLLSDAINGFDASILFPNAPTPVTQPAGPRFDPVAAAAANMQPPAPPPPAIPQIGYDPTVQNQIPAVAVDSQGNARPMSAEEFLAADTQRQAQQDMGLTPDVQKAIADRNVSQSSETAPEIPSDLVKRLIESGWVPPDKRPKASDGNNPNPDPATVEGIGQDLEQLYQQDVKDGIKQRLGLEQPPAPEPAAPKPASYAESPFLREIAARGGVNLGERGDTSVDPNRQTSTGRVMPNPYNIAGKPLFRPDGLRGDALVESLVSQGYISQAQVDEADAGGVGGSDQLAYDLIRKELENPGSVRPINQQDDAAAQVLQQRASSELDSKARSIGLDTKGLSDDQVNLALKRIERRLQRSKGRADVSREVKAEREAMDDVAGAPDINYDDSDIPWDEPGNMSEAEAMRALGFTDQEIQDAALANRPSPAQARPEDASQTAPNEPAGPQGPAPADARGEGGQQQAPAVGEGLTSYTPEELRRRDQRIAEQARTEERRKADEEARAKADSQRGEFALTGSDRPADVAAAGGQADIFSQAAQQQEPAPAPVRAPVATSNRIEDSGQVLEGARKPMYSRPEDAGASTPDTIRAALRERFGDLISKMEARGFLKIWPSTQAFNDGQTSEHLEGPVQGYWDGKQAHLFADGIAPGNEVAVLLHEVGEHASMEDMLGPNQYAKLVQRANDLVDQGDPIAVRAMNRIPDDTPNQYVDSELLAYMIETVAADEANASPGLRKLFDDVVAAIRAWFAQTGFNKMLDRYGKGIELTPADIAALAVRAVRWQAEQGTSTAPGGKMATAPRPAQSTAAQQAANVFGGVAPPVTGNPAGPSAAAAAPWSVAEPGRLDDLIRRLQDSRVDIRRTVDAVKATGTQISDDANPYLMDELYIGKVRAQIDRLADSQVTPLLRAISNSGFTPAQVNDYLWARHAEERNRQMAKVNNVPFTPALDLAGMSTADANAKLAAARALPNFAQMQAIARMVDTITSDARTRIVTDGLEDASVIQAWEGAYKNYVPLQRDVEESGGKASGYNVKGPEARRAVGSSKEAVNILANVIAQAEATIIRAEKAAVGRSVLDMARQNPNPSFWSVDTPPTERAIDPRTGLVTTRVKPNFKALDNVFVVKEAGVEHFVTFNEKNPRAVQFARSLKNMNAANLGPVMQTISKATRYLASWVTSRNPLFWMTNFARDVQGVAFNLQSTSLKGQAPQVMAKIPQALAGVASNKLKGSGRWAQLAQEFADAGGQTGYLDNYRDSVERMGEIEKDIERMQQGRADPRRVARAVLDVVDGANDVIENGVRLAVYAQAREEGLSEAQSASIAKNISVNFNRKGNDTAAYNALYMFFNANVQGNVRMIQAIKDSRRAQIYAGALTLAGAAVALLNWQLGGDDEESRRKRYQLVPEWERERNWIVFIPGTDSYVKIPLPLGPHVLFNAGRVLSELGLEKGADPMEKAASFASSLIGAFNPVGGGLPSADAKGVAQVATPTVLRPITDLVVNQNFAGTPVAKEKSPFGYNKPAYANGRESTPSYWTTAAKAMNDWTGGDNVKPGAVNLSPEQLAYLVKGYAVPGIAQTADKMAGQAMSRKDTPVDQIVGVSKFFGTIDENERSRAAFDTARKDREKAGQYQAYLKAGERQKANELLTQWGNGDPAVGRKLLGQAQTFERLMTSINRERRSVQALPEDARNERLNRLDERMQRQQAVYLRNRAALIDTPDE